MTPGPIDAHRREIGEELQAGNATEHTHRPALKTLIESLASGVMATDAPRHVDCGVPDLAVSKKAARGFVAVGHVDVIDMGNPLDQIEKKS